VTVFDRRTLLLRTGAALAAGGLGAFADLEEVAAAPRADEAVDWASVRRQFRVAPGWVHMAGLYLASHPAPVRRAIARHHRGLDANPVHYLHDRGAALEAAVLRAAGAYLRVRPADIALTDSTTMGLGLLYNGVELRAGQEALTTTHDFYATHEALRLKAARTGATVRRVRLYREARRASADEIVSSLVDAVGPRTRVIAVTWVHSSTGVKLPIARIARALGERRRQVLLCVDGVHGLGVENAAMSGLGCDFFVAGCHKWLFGPRGTGIVWGRPTSWDSVEPTIPTFSGTATAGAEMTPGGFHSFEHRWALAEAFRLHLRMGKGRVARRIQTLNTRLKRGLGSMSHVTLVTPQSPALSSGLVCFSVDRLSPGAVVEALRRRRIVATVTPYDPPYARLSPGLLNTPGDVDRALRAIRSLR
jgi:isopenicillin-N epimerase